MRFLCLGAAAIAATFVVHPVTAASLTLNSADFKNDQTMPKALSYRGYGCTGDNVSPELRWYGAPPRTKSYALTVFDPDARRGAGWWHWVIFNIPSSVRQLPRGAGDAQKATAPSPSQQGVSSFRSTGYGGPCPPPGDAPHHYVFTLYALDVGRIPGADATTSGEKLASLAQKNVLAKAQLTGRFGR